MLVFTESLLTQGVSCAKDGGHTFCTLPLFRAEKGFFYAIEGGMSVLDKRIGVVGIVLDNRQEAADKVNAILSQYGDIIIGRMGIPKVDKGAAVIALIVEGSTDQIGALTGKLGQIKSVVVKSALTSKIIEDGIN